MGPKSTPTLYDVLQAEFSPPLDTSLIAAIVADYVNEKSKKKPSKQDIETLRQVLSELAAQAEKDEDVLSERLSGVQFSATEDTTSINDLFSAESSTTRTASTSDASGTSQYSLSSPLRFLRAAFPDISEASLRSALGSADDVEDITMELVVEDIMSSEYTRELEERGVEDTGAPEVEVPWEKVEPLTTTGKKGKKKKVTTITLVDIRQKQHARPVSKASTSRACATDPWTQLSSVTSHLETLIPSRPASYFQSVFHDPKYSTPSEALRDALYSLIPSATRYDEASPNESLALFNMFEILTSDCTILAETDSDQLMADALLALRVSDYRPDAALDIVQLIRDLERGEVDWGIYHSPPPTSPVLFSNGAAHPSKHTLKSPSGPPPIQPPKERARSKTSPVTPMSPFSPTTNAWKTIPMLPRRQSNPHVAFIPSYAKSGAGKTAEKPKTHKQKAGELRAQRMEALREASRAWQRGNTKTRGGEIAAYYAEKARELDKQVRQENCEAALERVQASRKTASNGCTIDLHGTTVPEALHIVNIQLAEECPTQAKPLRIITGRGNHSANGVSVLAPAVRAALVSDGWLVGTIDAGLVVRGKSGVII